MCTAEVEEEEAVEAEEYFDCVGESMKCNTTAIFDTTDETDGPPPKPGKGRWHVKRHGRKCNNLL